MSTVLLIAASRGLGLAMAEQFLDKGWNVVGTVRGKDRTALHDLADRFAGRLEIEQVDINDESQILGLEARLTGRAFDLLFVNAGTTNDPTETIGTVTTDEFTRVMITNALSPMRTVEILSALVTPTGLIGVMSSGQGSVTNNTKGMREIYRASKAALNQLMRSYAARAGNARALVLMAPGWVKTDLGGPDAPLTIADSVPRLVNVLLDKQGKPGLEYRDYKGEMVPW